MKFAGEDRTWSDFTSAITAEFAAKKASGGQGIRILTEAITSPTLSGQINSLLKEYPNMRWHQFDPLGSDNAKSGIKLAFGDDVTRVPIYHFDAAKVIVALDDNFLADHPGSRLTEYDARLSGPITVPPGLWRDETHPHTARG